MKDTRSPITRMIDAACGYDPNVPVQVPDWKRRENIMTEVLNAVEAWYCIRNTKTNKGLREAWEALLAEDERSATPKEPMTTTDDKHKE